MRTHPVSAHRTGGPEFDPITAGALGPLKRSIGSPGKGRGALLTVPLRDTEREREGRIKDGRQPPSDPGGRLDRTSHQQRGEVRPVQTGDEVGLAKVVSPHGRTTPNQTVGLLATIVIGKFPEAVEVEEVHERAQGGPWPASRGDEARVPASVPGVGFPVVEVDTSDARREAREPEDLAHGPGCAPLVRPQPAAEPDEAQVQLLRLLQLGRCKADRALKRQDRLIEIAAQLIRRAEVRGGAEVVRMVAVSGTQHGEGRVDRPYAQMQRAEVRSKTVQDQEWQAVIKKGSPLLVHMESVVLIPTEVSPLD